MLPKFKENNFTDICEHCESKKDILRFATILAAIITLLFAVLLSGTTAHAAEIAHNPNSPVGNIDGYSGDISADSDGFYHYTMNLYSLLRSGKDGYYSSIFTVKTKYKFCLVIDYENPHNPNSFDMFYDGYLLTSREPTVFKVAILPEFYSSVVGSKIENLYDFDWKTPQEYINGERIAFIPYLPVGKFSISTNMPIFGNKQDALDYMSSGNSSGAVNLSPTIPNTKFYLKNIGYSVRAENSSEYPDETFIKFTWDTDNLQNGDLLEIKTRNHYTKIGGEQLIGFHDYITYKDRISCMDGGYEMSQTAAVKAWFNTLKNKPFIFKDYDTDIYFIRPVRGVEYGLWAKITMHRDTPTSSPVIKDIEYGDIDDDGDWNKDDDVTDSEGGNHGIDQGGNIIPPDDAINLPDIESIGDLFKYLLSLFNNLIGYFSDFPILINSVIGWLPSPIILLICSSVVIVIILRIFGR